MLSNLEVTEIVDKQNITRIANLLQIKEAALVTALTTRSIVTQNDRVVSRLGAAQALDVRDGLVKHIYGRLFLHIVRRINDAIYK